MRRFPILNFKFPISSLLCLLLTLACLRAQEPAPPAPPALTEYKGRTIAQTMHWTGAEWLLRQNREQEENAALMIKELKIQPGWTICDLGCGNGYHSLTMSAMVGEKGKILAVDIQQPMLDMLAARAKGRGIANIQTILGAYHDPRLPDASCDLILLVDVYHEFSHPEQQLKAMHRALKPGGQVALVEFRAEDEKVPIRPEHKMSREQIKKEWLPAGFEIAREFDGLPWQHLIFLRKAKTEAAAPAPETAPVPAPGKK
ncbi:MAG: class I SAM-dependent methyltransferase [Verrucomicrobiota bacterium]